MLVPVIIPLIRQMLLNPFQIPKGHTHLLQNNSFESDLFFLLIVVLRVIAAPDSRNNTLQTHSVGLPWMRDRSVPETST